MKTHQGLFSFRADKVCWRWTVQPGPAKAWPAMIPNTQQHWDRVAQGAARTLWGQQPHGGERQRMHGIDDKQSNPPRAAPAIAGCLQHICCCLLFFLFWSFPDNVAAWCWKHLFTWEGEPTDLEAMVLCREISCEQKVKITAHLPPPAWQTLEITSIQTAREQTFLPRACREH